MPSKRRSPSRISFRSAMRICMLSLFLLAIAVAAVGYITGALSTQPSPAVLADGISPSPTAKPTPAVKPTPSAEPSAKPDAVDGKLAFYALRVGQADALALVSPSGKVMMVDAGESDAFPIIDAFLKERGIKRIDVLVATHPHSDHIGSMRKVIESYDVGHIYMSHAVHTTSLYRKLLDAVEKQKIPLTTVRSGMRIDWDDQVSVAVFAPQEVEYKNLNNYSVVLKLTYGETSFLLTGDAEKESEKKMLETYAQGELKADVLKAGHHGSATSSTKAFLQAISPRIVVFTVNPDDEKHPDPAVVKRLKALKVQMPHTSSGLITIISDGKTVSIP